MLRRCVPFSCEITLMNIVPAPSLSDLLCPWTIESELKRYQNETSANKRLAEAAVDLAALSMFAEFGRQHRHLPQAVKTRLI
jgi:hypothetical protein